jgi:chromosome segregation protein
MKIKRLELSGFKSFVDKTVVNFDHEVLGIVGPNGCGKSNIVDAIRWCMGEQSAKHLRGKSMEDVIFNGSESRGGSDFAEVTLTFENDVASEVPLEFRDYPEIAVTRRLHRSGDSEYLINKTQVRLKDVTDLFLGTGVGTRAYSIVEQGKIGLIVSAKPEDRRLLIEEAAGITKFKSKKKQAERKMELTAQNLLRVGDIVAEIERNLGSLKRQAAKAERYVSYRAELEDLQLNEASHRYLEHAGYIQYERGNVGEGTLAHEDARQALTSREAELESLRAAAHEADEVLEQATTVHFATENEVRTLDGAIARAKDRLESLARREEQVETEMAEIAGQADELSKERIAFEAEVNRALEAESGGQEALTLEESEVAKVETTFRDAERLVQTERDRKAEAERSIATAEARIDGFERRRLDMDARADRTRFDLEEHRAIAGELEARKRRLTSDVEELRSGKMTTAEDRERLESDLLVKREAIIESERDLELAKTKHQAARSRLAALTEVQARLDGVGAGTKAMMSSGDELVLGLVADRVEASSEHTAALAGLLGSRLQEVVVSDLEGAVALLRRLGEEKRGRATIISQYPRMIAGTALRSVDETATRLRDALRFRPEDATLVESLIGDALLVESEEEAQRLLATAATCAPIVTLAGTVFYPDGRVSGGSGDDLAFGMLETKREIRKLSEELVRLEVQVARELERFHLLRAAIAELQTALERARYEAHQGELALVTAEKDLKTAEIDIERTAKRLVQLEADTEELCATVATQETERTAAIALLESAKAALEEIGTLLAAVESDAITAGERLHIGRERLTETKVLLAGFRERLFAARSALTRITRSVEELVERRTRLGAERDHGAANFGETVGQLFLHREELGVRQSEAREAEALLREAREASAQHRSELSGRESALKDLRNLVDQTREALTSHELKLREHSIALEHLCESIREKFRGLILGRIIGDYHMRQAPDAETRSRISELGSLIERMGSVNLEAMKEHAEAEERFTFYTTQKADLDQALSDLERAINQMNRESKRLFKETFDAVNERFRVIFPKMFRGGQASLRLTNPEDMLETGIDILAQPPGKKLSSIELMSGGEKALTAVSLIFAIFQIKPSPFCILDEVDAPLDEANVARYNEMVREMTDRSQFILITHIKRTMQMVDVLYGVTMQEPGVSRLVSVNLTESSEKRRAVPRLEQAAVA